MQHETVTLRTCDLIGAALDWAVAKTQGVEIELSGSDVVWAKYAGVYSPSTDWAQLGPLQHEHAVALKPADEYIQYGNYWDAEMIGRNCDRFFAFGPDPLIAACRAIVSAHLGDSVDVPAELVGGGYERV